MRALLTVLLSFFVLGMAMSTVALADEAPPYAKWGKIAMEETMKKYPNEKVIDYLHIGRELKPDYIVEKFKFWLKGENREFGLFVDIKFEYTTEKIISVDFSETSFDRVDSLGSKDVVLGITL